MAGIAPATLAPSPVTQLLLPTQKERRDEGVAVRQLAQRVDHDRRIVFAVDQGDRDGSWLGS
jgi:hypothetical protein